MPNITSTMTTSLLAPHQDRRKLASQVQVILKGMAKRDARSAKAKSKGLQQFFWLEKPFGKCQDVTLKLRGSPWR